jgi:glycosyltransferase involved in cell wall biosynthesis
MFKYLFEKIVSIYVLFYYRTTKETKNSVSYFNTFDIGGGAAKVCFQLFTNNPNSVLFVREKRSSDDRVIAFDPDLWSRIGQFARKIEKRGIIDYGKIGSFNLMRNLFFSNSKILHLHNTHGYYLSFLALKHLAINKKVVWTLHDEYLLSGHCSFTINCDRWKKGCGSCPDLKIYPSLEFDSTQINLLEKKKILFKIQPFIVAPSEWLAKRVKIKYPFLKNIQVIYNGVDLNVFKPKSNLDELKIKYNIPLQKFIVLFVAELSLANPFKGGDILIEIINEFKNRSDILFLTIGGNSSDYPNVISLPYIADEVIISDLYGLSDVMLYPTKADNLPLVVLESMACGTPVISSNIGGISEIIDDTKNGFLIDENNKTEFIKILHTFYEMSEDKKSELSNNAIQKIKHDFSLEKMLSSYKRLYKNLI